MLSAPLDYGSVAIKHRHLLTRLLTQARRHHTANDDDGAACSVVVAPAMSRCFTFHASPPGVCCRCRICCAARRRLHRGGFVVRAVRAAGLRFSGDQAPTSTHSSAHAGEAPPHRERRRRRSMFGRGSVRQEPLLYIPCVVARYRNNSKCMRVWGALALTASSYSHAPRQATDSRIVSPLARRRCARHVGDAGGVRQ